MRNRIFSGLLAVIILCTMIPAADAASSAELKKQIESLEQEQTCISEQLEVLQEKETTNWDSIEEMVAQKNNIDEQIFLLYSQLDNLEDQIMEYGQLIAENQQKLDDAQAQLSELNMKYKERIRAMEEGGEISYWSVLFKASSFSDLLDRLSMVQEIAAADEQMLEQLDAAAKEVESVQEELVSQKSELEQSRAEQMTAKEALEQKRTEADEVLTQLNEERSDLQQDHALALNEKNALVAEIAQAEQEYNEARRREAEEARKREEEQRRREEEEKRKEGAQDHSEPEATPEPEETKPQEKPQPEPEEKPSAPQEPEERGWLQPCSYICITSPYGYRSSGWHNGVDFANNRGTPIYAARSGTVTKTRVMQTSYGNHVVVNHGDGYSSLYAHMEYFVVSTGQYVHQGDLIGYMGDSGNASGPHLHFTVLYNGSDVNPMKFL